MPLGPFPDFTACELHFTSKGDSKELAGKKCGAIEKRIADGQMITETNIHNMEMMKDMDGDFEHAAIEDAEVKVIKITENGRLFLKTFLLDGSINANTWRVTPDSIPKNVNSIVGKPLVLTKDFSHPPLVDPHDASKNLTFQERYAIGRYISAFQDGKKWWGIAEITDSMAKDAISNNEVPFFVSPRIVHTQDEPRDAISHWSFIHAAIVDKPAYGEDATIDAICTGSLNACVPALLSASVDDLKCQCPKLTLLSLLNTEDASKTQIQTKVPDNLDSSKIDRKEQYKNVMGDAQPVDMSNYILKTDYDTLKAEMTAQKVAFEEAKKAFDSKLAAIEEETRKTKITNILSAKIEDQKVLTERIQYFMDAKVSPDVVEKAFEMVPAIAKKDNTEKFTIQDAKVEISPLERMIAYENKLIRRGA